jgi:4-amino-4-deoxy-L-arabinose transferase-like glycosyltransferase
MPSATVAPPRPPQQLRDLEVAAPSRRSLIPEVTLLSALALLVRLAQLDHGPHTDELNHILGARSLLRDGTMLLAEGGDIYDRAWVFTSLVAGMFRFFGESLVVARVPAVLAGTALVVGLFLAVRSVSGRSAAWFAALLLCFSPIAIFQSQQVRFYTLQALFFGLGALLLYRASLPGTREPRLLVALTAAALACFGMALHLQIISAAGVGVLVAWALVSRGVPALRAASPRQRGLWLGALSVMAVAAVAVLVSTGMLSWAFGMFTYADAWAEPERYNFRYYHWHFLQQYPTLWTLFPLSLLIAAAAYPRPALFCGLLFGAVFAFHSAAAWKAERFLFYVLPFFFALSGMAFGRVVPWVYRRLRERMSVAAKGLPVAVPARGAPVAAAGLLVGALVFTVFANGATSYSLRMILRGDADWQFLYPYRGDSDWLAAAPVLAPEARRAGVVLGSSELKTLFFLDRLDYDLAPESRAIYGGEGPEGAVSFKTGRPWLVDVPSLQRVMACHPSGLAVIEHGHWRQPPWGVDHATADFLQAHAQPLVLPESWRLLAFRWNEPVGTPPAGGCP